MNNYTIDVTTENDNFIFNNKEELAHYFSKSVLNDGCYIDISINFSDGPTLDFDTIWTNDVFDDVIENFDAEIMLALSAWFDKEAKPYEVMDIKESNQVTDDEWHISSAGFIATLMD